MPNHVTNIVTFEDFEISNLESLVEFVRSEDSDFDFNQIMPMPQKIRDDKELLTTDRRSETKGRNWYDWSCNHWGTKWNCYDSNYDEKIYEYFFMTAWSAPFPVLTELSRLFPEITIIHQWCDEDWCSGNLGEIHYRNGEIIYEFNPDGKEQTKRLAEEILGYTLDEN